MRFLARLFFAFLMLLAPLQVLLLPLWFLYAQGRLGVAIMWHVLPGLRAALRENAAHLLGPESTPEQRTALGREVLRNFARFFVEILAAPKTYPDPDAFFERTQGKDHALSAHGKGKGVIGITLHMGNMELGCQMLTRMFAPVAVVYRRDPYGLVEAMRSGKRRDHRVEEIATNDSPMFGVRVLAILKEGGFVLTSGDLGAPEEGGVAYPFLDGTARFFAWPARLSKASGAPIVPCFVVREDGHYVPRLEPPIHPEDHEDATSIMKALVAVYEDYVRRYPDQWLILHKYWSASEAS